MLWAKRLSTNPKHLYLTAWEWHPTINCLSPDSLSCIFFFLTTAVVDFVFDFVSFSSSGCQVRCWPRESTARLNNSRSKVQISYRYLNTHLFWGRSSFVTSAWMKVALLWWPFSRLFFSTKLSMKSTAVTWSALVSRCLVKRLERHTSVWIYPALFIHLTVKVGKKSFSQMLKC